MTTKLFVASLPFEFTDEKLQELFAAMGQVLSAKMVMDRKHGRTRGFGFVTMSSEAEAQAAMEKLNGSMVGERKVWVTPARPEKERAENAAGSDDRAAGNERFVPRRGGGANSFRHRRPPNRDANPRGGKDFNSLLPGSPGGESRPRRPFGRSGRGMDFQGNPSYYGGGSNPSSSGGPRRSGGWRPRTGPPSSGSGSGQPYSGGPRRNGGSSWRPKNGPSGGGTSNPEGSSFGSRGPSNRRGFQGRSQGSRPSSGKPFGSRPPGRFNRSSRPPRPS